MVTGVVKATDVYDDSHVRFIHHVVAGKQACGATWGEMSPPRNRPGVLHWCDRSEPDHPGKHRCGCGSYSDTAQVVCRFPVDDGARECGRIVTGTEATRIKAGPFALIPSRQGTIGPGEMITSTPCGHPVRRGF